MSLTFACVTPTILMFGSTSHSMCFSSGEQWSILDIDVDTREKACMGMLSEFFMHVERVGRTGKEILLRLTVLVALSKLATSCITYDGSIKR